MIKIIVNTCKAEKDDQIRDHSWNTLICPLALETSGVFGPDASAVLRDLARRIKDVFSENSRAYLLNLCLRCREAMQHLSWGML